MPDWLTDWIIAIPFVAGGVLIIGYILGAVFSRAPESRCQHISSPTVWTDAGWRKHCLKCGCDMTWDDGNA